MNRIVSKHLDFAPDIVQRNAGLLVCFSGLISLLLLLFAHASDSFLPATAARIVGPATATGAVILMFGVAVILMRSLMELTDDALLEKVRRANTALADSERRFRNLFETSPDAIICRRRNSDGRMNLVEANARYLEIFGYQEGELQSEMADGRRLTEATRERVRTEYMPILLRDGMVTDTELNGIRRDGTVFPIRGDIWAVKDDHGDVIETWSILRDVSEQEDSKRTVEESEKRFRKLFESSRDGLISWKLDASGKASFDSCNPAFKGMFGLTAENAAEIIQASRHMTKESHERWTADHLPTLLSEGFVEEFAMDGIRSDGTSFPARSSAWLVKDDSGNTIAMWAAIRDVSEKVRVERDLALKNLALEQTSSAVAIFNAKAPGDSSAYVNPAFEKMTGFNASDLGHENPLGEFIESDSDRAEWDKFYDSLRDGLPILAKLKSRRKDGSMFIRNIQASPVRDERGAVSHWITISRDITEDQEAEEQLNIMRRALEQTPNAVVIVEDGGNGIPRIIFANHAIKELHGLSPENIVGQPSSVFRQSGAVSPELANTLSTARNQGEPVNAEGFYQRPDGSKGWLNVRYAPIRNTGGAITHWISYSADDTEQRAAERQLSENAIIIEQLGEAVFRTDKAGLILSCNKIAEQLLGRTKKEIVGQRLSSFCSDPAQARAASRASLQHLNTEGKGTWEAKLTTPNGDDIIIETSGGPFKDENGDHAGYVSVVRDVTKKRESETLIRRNAIILEQLSDAVFLTGMDGRIIDCNQMMQSVLGRPRGEIIGRRPSEFGRDPDDLNRRNQEKIGASLEIGEFSAEFDWVDAQGEDLLFACNARLWTSPEGNREGWIGVGRDITQQRANEQRLRDLERAIQQSRSFVAVFSDQKNGPPTLTYGNTALEALTRQPLKSLIGKTPTILDENRIISEHVRSQIMQAFVDKEALRFRATHILGEGQLVEFEIDAGPVFDDSGNVTDWIVTGKDITVQVRAEEELRVVKRAVEQAPISIVISETRDDGAPQITFTNQQFQKTVGVSDVTAIGRSSASFSEEGLIGPEFAENLAAARTQGEAREFSGPLTRKDGLKSWIEGRYAPVRNDQNKITHWISFAIDVTAKHDAEQQRRLLERAIERAPVGIAVMKAKADDYSTTEYVNPAFTEMFGIGRESLQGKPVSSFVKAGFIDADSEKIIMQARETKTAADLEISIERPHKETRILDISYTPIFDESDDDNVDFWIGVVEDRTEQRREEQQRRILEQAIEASPSSISILRYHGDNDPVFSYVNPAFEVMSGFSAVDVIGAPFTRLVSSTNRDRDRINAYRAGNAMEFTDWSVRKDGTAYVREVKTAAVQDGNGNTTHLVTLSNDVTERFENEQQMRKLQLAIDQNDSSVTFWDVTNEGLKLAYANEAHERITGYTLDELIGGSTGTVKNRNHFAPGATEEWHNAIAEGRSTTITIETQRKDGRWIVRELDMAPVRDNKGEIFSWLVLSRDVTQKMKDEARLWKLENAVSQTDSAVMITEMKENGSEMEISFVNPAFERMIGLSAKDLLGKRPRVIQNRNPGDENVLQDLFDSIQKGESKDVIIETQRSDGSWFMRHLEATPVRHSADQSLSWIGVSRDVTQQIADDKRLRILERAIEQTPSAVAVIDRSDQDAKFVYVNPAFERMTGYSRDDFIGQPYNMIESRNYGSLNSGGVLNEGYASNTAATTYIETRHKDGHWFVREMTIAPITNDTGENAGWISTSADVTDRLKNENQLRKDALILKTLGEAVTSTDPDGIIVDCNAGATKLYGRSAEEIIGTSIVDIVADRDSFLRDQPNRIRRAREGKVIEGEVVIKKGNGENALVEYVAAPFLDVSNDLLGMVTVARDITEKRELENQLRQAQKMESLGQLTGGIAHDFNNLMGVISGSLQLIESENEDWSFVKEMAATANKSTMRGKDLVDRLLAFSRRQTLQTKATDVGALLQETSDLLQRSMGESIDFTLDLAPDLPPCQLDQSQFESAIVNLAVNARDAMGAKGQLTIAAHETIAEDDDAPGLNRGGRYVHIEVIDTGKGIEEETLDKIFEPFFTTKDIGEGSGLGLSMVYGFVKQSGGHISVDSTPGQGTTFSLYFPTIDSTVEDENPAKIDGDKTTPKHEIPILVVEDNQEMLKVSRIALSRMGYRVVAADCAATAMTMLTEHPEIRTAFIDIMLPDGMTGTELAKILISVRPQLRVLFTSGYSDDEVLHDALALSDVVRKPFDLQELESKLKALAAGDEDSGSKIH